MVAGNAGANADSGRPPVTRVRIPADAVVDWLAAAPLFADVERRMLEAAAPAITGIEAVPRSVLVPAGVRPDGLGVLLVGRATVEVPFATGGSFTIDVLAPGATFGGAGLLSASLSPVQVIADENCKALWLPADVVAMLLQLSARFADRLARELAHQLARVCALPRSGPGRADDAVDVLPGSPSASSSAAGSIPFVDVTEIDVTPAVASLLPGRVIRSARALPLGLADNTLRVAFVAPKNAAAIEAVRQLYPQVRLEVAACSLEDFERVLARLRLDDGRAADARAKERASRGVITPDSLAWEDPGLDRDVQTRAGTDEAVRIVNKLLAAALDRDATDVHVEPATTSTRVRFRVDGQMQDWGENLAPGASRWIAARLKVLAGLDLTDRKAPQEGRISLIAGSQKREVDLRVAMLPMRIGEKIAIHIQDAAPASSRSLERIVVEPRALDLLRRTLGAPGGLVVAAGENGSGVTSTLYAMIGEKRRVLPAAAIVTVEDPIEQRLGGVTQLAVSPHLGFASTLQAAARQDPDVLVAGDVRDAASASVLLEAGLAGRSALAVVHADGAVAALLRLVALSAARARVGQAVSAVVAQRLVRRLCGCAASDPAPRPLLQALLARRLVADGAPPLVGRPVGCEQCAGSGVLGRAPVTEVLFVNDDVRVALALEKPRADIENVALHSGALVPFSACAAVLLRQRVIPPAEALLVASPAT